MLSAILILTLLQISIYAKCLRTGHLFDYQDRLLQTAFDVASKIPLEPHIKDRSRKQQDVVNTALELNQPEKALEFASEIQGWRRGLSYADIAYRYAFDGYFSEAEECLSLAEASLGEAEDWRKDSLIVAIERAKVLIGKTIEDFEEDIIDSEKGKIAAAKVNILTEEQFAAHTVKLDEMISTGVYDILLNALKAYAAVYNKFYDDEEKRDAVEKKIMDSWNAIPIFVRVDLLIELAGYANNNSDNARALNLVAQGKQMLDGFTLRTEHYIKIASKLCILYYQSADEDSAKEYADMLLEKFNDNRQQIVNIYRGDVLAAIAEAYSVMGDKQKSIELYSRALSEALVNPNSRPRALDLAGVCCSAAKFKVEPNEQLWQKIYDIKKGLSDPW